MFVQIDFDDTPAPKAREAATVFFSFVTCCSRSRADFLVILGLGLPPVLSLILVSCPLVRATAEGRCSFSARPWPPRRLAFNWEQRRGVRKRGAGPCERS